MFTGRRLLRHRLAVAGLALAGAIAEAPPCPAQAPPPGDAPAVCGAAAGGPILSKWTSLGGASSRLGCPTTRESAAPASPRGTQSREMTFADGGIVWHTSGPRAGQTFAVNGCIWRLYFQYGGPSGWLGLPVADASNTPDGQKQVFEGGVVTYKRTPDACEATPTPEAAPIAADAPAPPKAPLDLFFDPARGDYLAAASAPAASRAMAAHYRRLRTQAYVFTDQAPGTTPLKLYWNEARGVHVAVATADGERDALAGGDTFEGVQGFIYTDPRPGTVPLKQFANPAGRGRLAAGAEDEAQAAAEGYAFVRIEGYAPAAP